MRHDYGIDAEEDDEEGKEIVLWRSSCRYRLAGKCPEEPRTEVLVRAPGLWINFVATQYFGHVPGLYV